jgi:broad specificity phosphatase PhoE
MTPPSAAEAGAPTQIYVIRHGEKPGNGASLARHGLGVDVDGSQSSHALLPRGWQRAGALGVLFAPEIGPLRTGLRTPTALYSPDYGTPRATRGHRTYQTIEGISALLKVPIATPCAVNQEAAVAAAAFADASDVVLICWDHKHIPAIAAALPLVPATRLPEWPDGRFDMIWSFTLQTAASPARYAFSQIPQRLLAGDVEAVC